MRVRLMSQPALVPPDLDYRRDNRRARSQQSEERDGGVRGTIAD